MYDVLETTKPNSGIKCVTSRHFFLFYFYSKLVTRKSTKKLRQRISHYSIPSRTYTCLIINLNIIEKTTMLRFLDTINKSTTKCIPSARLIYNSKKTHLLLWQKKERKKQNNFAESIDQWMFFVVIRLRLPSMVVNWTTTIWNKKVSTLTSKANCCFCLKTKNKKQKLLNIKTRCYTHTYDWKFNTTLDDRIINTEWIIRTAKHYVFYWERSPAKKRNENVNVVGRCWLCSESVNVWISDVCTALYVVIIRMLFYKMTT